MLGWKLMLGYIFAATMLVSAPSMATAGVVRLDTARWPGGLVPYELGGGLSAEDRSMIAVAIRRWNAALKAGGAEVRFVGRNDADQRTLLILRVAPRGANRCRATPGFDAGRGLPSLDAGERLPPTTRRADSYILLSGTCSLRSVVHELGHVLGLLHEQNRTDRDSWISISLIPPFREPRCDEFSKVEWISTWCSGYAKSLAVSGPAQTLRDPRLLENADILFSRQYDVCSVMQYLEDPIHVRRHVLLRFTEKSHDWERTHQCRAGGAGGGVISALDIATVKAFYARR